MNFSHIHEELKRKGVTLMLLWHEYKAQNPQGYQYSQFCHLYRQWCQKLDPVMRQSHRAGEKLFVDYSGMTISPYRSRYRQNTGNPSFYRLHGGIELHLCGSNL